MTVEDLKTVFDYSYWANAGLRDVLSQVTTEQFTQPVAGSYGSIRDTMVHMLSAECELVNSAEPTPGEVQYLEDRLYEFNSAATGITDGEWLAIFVRDDHRIVAGICGNTHGFEVVAVVDDHPHGHKNMLLRKRLGAA